MEHHHNHLLQPLIPTTTTAAPTTTTSTTAFLSHHSANKIHKFIPSNLNIILRLVFVTLIGLISIWANHEASKGFAITVVNNSGDSPAGKRFSLFYESNDEATRTILRASKTVEKIIHSKQTNPKKQINQVILWLADKNLSHTVVVHSGEKSHQFILNLCPSIFEGTNFREATSLAILRGMAHIWLWGDPPEIVNGMIECIVNSDANGASESDFCPKSGDKITTMVQFSN